MADSIGLSASATQVAQGYTFAGPTLPLGALVENDVAVPVAQVGLPLSMMNRHGLIAGATGTGKTRTLQAMAEALSTAGSVAISSSCALTGPTARLASATVRAARRTRRRVARVMS